MSAGTPEVPQTSSRAVMVLVPLLVGAAVSVALGVYARVHDPTNKAIFTLFFSSLLSMKAWLATVAVALALFQLGSALRLYGRIRTGRVPRWVAPAHRASGTLAVVVSLPVAYHCLWSLGFTTFDTRTTVHSVAGCAFYGAFVAKMLTLKWRGLPGWALPVFGGLTFTALVVVWLTSSLWFFTNVGFPEF